MRLVRAFFARLRTSAIVRKDLNVGERLQKLFRNSASWKWLSHFQETFPFAGLPLLR